MRKLFNLVLFCTTIALMVAACSKNSSTVTSSAPEKATRTQTVDITGLGFNDATLTRALDGTWYIFDAMKVARKKPTQPWKFVPTLTGMMEVNNNICTWETLHPDNLLLSEPPSIAIHSWWIPNIPQQLAFDGQDWFDVVAERKITKPLPCPRACD